MEKEEEKTAKQRAGIMSARNRNGLCPYCGNFKHDGECVPTYENTDNTPGGHYIYDRISKEYIIRYRKKNGLCERCGNPPHDGECEEVFEKQKGKRTLPDDSAEKRRIGGIIAQRKRHGLCDRCGRPLHDGECEENYTSYRPSPPPPNKQPENKKEEQKKPKTVITLNSFDELDNAILQVKNDNIKEEKATKPVEEIKQNIELSKKDIAIQNIVRPKYVQIAKYFMFNLSPYDIYGKNYGMQLDAMCFLSNLYNDKVLYFFGDMTRYSYSDILTLSSHPNISRYPMQTNVNFIMEGLQSAEVVFTMDERFSEYCRHVGVKTVIFGRDDEYQTDKVLYININKTDDIDRMFVGCKYDKIKNFIES